MLHFSTIYKAAPGSKLRAPPSIIKSMRDAVHRLQPDKDQPARLDALRGQSAVYDGDKARASQLPEPAIAQMIAMRSPRFEIERA